MNNPRFFRGSNYENWKFEYFDGYWHYGWNKGPGGRTYWDILNIYPIYLFSDANSRQFGVNYFAERLLDFFKALTGEKYEGIDEILRLK